MPANPYPPQLGSNIPVDANLSWTNPEEELLLNGGFEAGDFRGWVRVSGFASFILAMLSA